MKDIKVVISEKVTNSYSGSRRTSDGWLYDYSSRKEIELIFSEPVFIDFFAFFDVLNILHEYSGLSFIHENRWEDDDVEVCSSPKITFSELKEKIMDILNGCNSDYTFSLGGSDRRRQMKLVSPMYRFAKNEDKPLPQVENDPRCLYFLKPVMSHISLFDVLKMKTLIEQFDSLNSEVPKYILKQFHDQCKHYKYNCHDFLIKNHVDPKEFEKVGNTIYL